MWCGDVLPLARLGGASFSVRGNMELYLDALTFRVVDGLEGVEGRRLG